MTISDMSDQEKSVMLAKLLGWKIDYEEYGQVLIRPPEYPGPYGIRIMGFYGKGVMEYAWRVLNWVALNDDLRRMFYGFWDNADLWELSPAEAQRLWLDKILELAIEAGLVKDDTINHP